MMCEDTLSLQSTCKGEFDSTARFPVVNNSMSYGLTSTTELDVTTCGLHLV